MFPTYRKPLIAVSLLVLAALVTFQIVSAQIYLPLIHNGSDAGIATHDSQAATTADPPPTAAEVLSAAKLAKGKKLDTRPTWEITVPGTDQAVVWVDHQPNPRFAIWDMGTTSNLRDDVVLDKETGLVWEREPEASTTFWFEAQLHCMERAKGGRTGWRLPTIEELLTLPDPASTAQLWLPAGHPFVERAFTAAVPFLSATSAPDTDPDRQNRVFTIILYNSDDVGFPDRFGTLDKAGDSGGYLCVRGGSGQELTPWR